MASGFFVAPGIVATSLHVVDGAGGGEAKGVGDEMRYTIAGVLAFDVENDLALLRVIGATARALTLDDTDAIAVGDEVFAIGSAGGYEGTFSQGLVSGIRRMASTRLLQISAPMSHGSSGGPILNTAGRVVGVATALVEGEQNLNFASPASALRPLLAQLNSPTPVAATWRVIRGGSEPSQSRDVPRAIAARTSAKWVVRPLGR